jgi:uncharacterized membrane protein YoaK (UPF0700 family)
MRRLAQPARAEAPGAPPSGGRLLLLSSILGSFVFGSACGALGFGRAAHWSMLPPVLLLVWILIVDLRAPIGEIDARRFERP